MDIAAFAEQWRKDMVTMGMPPDMATSLAVNLGLRLQEATADLRRQRDVLKLCLEETLKALEGGTFMNAWRGVKSRARDALARAKDGAK